jgi:predicted AlkP superfamily pyrophosphatase or phosphodiesterase
MPAPLLVINAVGLTPRLLPHAPRLGRLAAAGWCVPLGEVTPAVTCTAQATLLTGQWPDVHGVVANGWLFRDTNEVRFWQQSNRLIQVEPVYATARRRAARRGRRFTAAKLFWWFNQGAAVDWAVTPKPHYAADGRKAFDVLTTPSALGLSLKQQLGPFPFAAFWGPGSGIDSTRWIAAAAAVTLLDHQPDLTLAYLPHLDYDPQRCGPAGCDLPRLVGELDEACGPLVEAAAAVGARVWVVSEYGHRDVAFPVYPNRALRQAGLLTVRDGPFGEQLDTYASRAFAVCDHQLAHVYTADAAANRDAFAVLGELPGVARVLAGERRGELSLEHPHCGELVLLADPEAWFAYPFWLNDRRAPDYARTVAIHHKPGFDPCELFFDPKLRFPKVRVARRLVQKSLGFRMTMDVIPLDASLVRGSHGLPAANDADRPLWIGDGPMPTPPPVQMTAFRNAVLSALGLDDE